ncbi:MAG: DUF1992 domain-containing protein [Acidobacteria bacterium]|nr:DUF1992 domain-containing protein [Acidobacteriota bacterium]
MNFDKLVEEKVREAMANGDFDNLSGKGKPIDLTAYFATPEDWRVGYALLKNAGVMPQEIELLKELEALKEQYARCADEGEKAKLKREIDDRTLKFSLLVESYKGKGRAR